MKNIYLEYDDDAINKDDDEEYNIIRVDIRKEKNAVIKIFKKLYFYIRNNPFSTDLFRKMEEIKQNCQKLNEIKNKTKINNKEKYKLNLDLKKIKKNAKIILKIRE